LALWREHWLTGERGQRERRGEERRGEERKD